METNDVVRSKFISSLKGFLEIVMYWVLGIAFLSLILYLLYCIGLLFL